MAGGEPLAEDIPMLPRRSLACVGVSVCARLAARAVAQPTLEQPVLPLPAADRQAIEALRGVGVVGEALPSRRW